MATREASGCVGSVQVLGRPDVSNAVATSEPGKIARQGGLGYQHGHHLWFQADVHGFHDGAVLDALEDAAPEIRVVGIVGLDLDDDGQGPAVIDDVDPVRGIQKHFGVGNEVPIAPANPGRIVPDPEAESPVVPALAAPCAADAVAFGALGRGGGGKTMAESLAVDLVPLGEGIDVGRDLFAGGAPLLRVAVAVAFSRQPRSAQIVGHERSGAGAGHAVALPHQEDVQQGTVGADAQDPVHERAGGDAHHGREDGVEVDFGFQPPLGFSVSERRPAVGCMDQPLCQRRRGVLPEIFLGSLHRNCAPEACSQGSFYSAQAGGEALLGGAGASVALGRLARAGARARGSGNVPIGLALFASLTNEGVQDFDEAIDRVRPGRAAPPLGAAPSPGALDQEVIEAPGDLNGHRCCAARP